MLEKYHKLKRSPQRELVLGLRGVICHIWDDTVLPATRHKWTHPALTPASKLVLDLPTRTFLSEIMYEKLTECPNFTRHQKNARILHHVCLKNIFRNFFFGGKGVTPLPRLYAYSWTPGLPSAKSGPAWLVLADVTVYRSRMTLCTEVVRPMFRNGHVPIWPYPSSYRYGSKKIENRLSFGKDMHHSIVGLPCFS